MVLYKQNLDTFSSFFNCESSSHLNNERRCINYLLSVQSYYETIKNSEHSKVTANLYSFLAQIFTPESEYNLDSARSKISEAEICILKKLLFDLDQNIKVFVPNITTIHEKFKHKFNNPHTLANKNGKNPFSLKTETLDVMALARTRRYH